MTASHVISSHAYGLYYHLYHQVMEMAAEKSTEGTVSQSGMSIQTDQQMTTGQIIARGWDGQMDG